MHIDIWTHNTSNLEAEAWKIDCEQRHENLSSLHLRLDELKTLAHMFLDVRTHTALDFWTPAVIIIILCTALLYFVWKGAVYSLKHKYCHLMCRTRLYLDYSCHVAAIWIWNQKFISWYVMFPIHFTINEGFFFYSRMAGCSPHFLPIYGWMTAVHCLRMADLTVMRRKYCRKTWMSVWLQVCIIAFIMSDDGGCRICRICAECENCLCKLGLQKQTLIDLISWLYKLNSQCVRKNLTLSARKK